MSPTQEETKNIAGNGKSELSEEQEVALLLQDVLNQQVGTADMLPLIGELELRNREMSKALQKMAQKAVAAERRVRELEK